MGKKRNKRKSNTSKKSEAVGGGNVKSRTSGAVLLQFPRSELGGLTPVSLSISSDKEAPSIIREIMQNSLDAATLAERESANVRFSLEKISVTDIPGIKEYKKAVDAIASRQEKKGWPEQSKDIIGKWQKSINAQTVQALIVTDNGIGLNKKTMLSILSDGAPEHADEHSTGSHGNGHFTPFNLSEMRYILYGGISEQDGKVASGHAILASHQGSKGICGKDGLLVTDIFDNVDKPYAFPEGEKIPQLILNQLNNIESEWGTGTVLIIPDFNYFGEDEKHLENTINMILGAAAQNFFVAVQRKGLVASVKAGNKKRELNADNIEEIMEQTSGIPRVRGFPNHKIANRFSRLYTNCKEKVVDSHIVPIDTGIGEFQFCYKTGDVSDTKIALCRNGMWITDSLSMLSPQLHFAEHIPFEGLLLCDANNSGNLHDYIRKAEGNLHNSLTLKLIQDKSKKRTLTKALQKTREFIQNHIGKQESESMDFLEITSEAIILSPPKQERIKRIDTGGQSSDGKGERDGGKSKGKSKSKGKGRSGGNSLGLRFTAARYGTNKIKIRIEATDTAADTELRLSLNGGGDISCANATTDNDEIIINAAECDGIPCQITNGCARLGEIKEGDSKIIDVTFVEPSIQGDYRIDCDILRRAKLS